MLLTEIANFLDESKLVPILVLAHMFFDKHRHIFGEFQACVCLAAAIHAIDRNRHFFGTIQACTFSAYVICLFDKNRHIFGKFQPCAHPASSIHVLLTL